MPLSVAAFALVPALRLWFWFQDRAGMAAGAGPRPVVPPSRQPERAPEHRQ
jgi:hypothetical protein